MTKIKIFCTTELQALENNLNEFIENNVFQVIDIKYDIVSNSKFYAMLLYIPKENS